jgi:hypothetical protein
MTRCISCEDKDAKLAIAEDHNRRLAEANEKLRVERDGLLVDRADLHKKLQAFAAALKALLH